MIKIGKSGKEKRDKKYKTLLKLYDLFGKHKQIIIISLENVGSLQIQQARKELALKKGLLVLGKNTVVKKAVALRSQRLPEDAKWDGFRKLGQKQIPELAELLPVLTGKIGFIFTDQPIFEVKQIVEASKVAAPAKVGVLAPIDVTIPPGPTGMDPSQISFFHALTIPTKIVKGQIEITKDYQVCYKDRKIGSSEVSLLQKMNLKPFFYNMNVQFAYDNGTILNKDICALNPDDILAKFHQGVKYMTAASLESGLVNELSIPSFLTNAFKNLAAIGLETNYKFKQISGAGQAPKAKVAEKPKEVAKVAPKVEEKVEEEEDFSMNMFD